MSFGLRRVLTAAAVTAAAAIGLLVADVGAADRDSHASRFCDSVTIGSEKKILYFKGMSCDLARRRAKRVAEEHKLEGWKCSSCDGFFSGGFCKKEGRYFGWHPGAG
jgi:hypothetical protein